MGRFNSSTSAQGHEVPIRQHLGGANIERLSEGLASTQRECEESHDVVQRDGLHAGLSPSGAYHRRKSPYQFGDYLEGRPAAA